MRKKVLNGLSIWISLMAVLFLNGVNAQAGPSVSDLSQTGLVNYPDGPFHLNTDRYKEAFQTLGAYLSTHKGLPASTILIADNHDHFLRGSVTQWTYYTYGTHKGIELYVHNPENLSQFLTIEIWMPKEQQWNLHKKEAYLSSFQQIEDFLTGNLKYRLDLVFQDNVPLDWGKGYCFKLDDESVSLSFTVQNPEQPVAETKMPMENKEKPSTLAPQTQPTPEATVTSKFRKKRRKPSKISESPTMVPTSTLSDSSR